MRKFADVEIEIRTRFYRWAMKDAEREVREEFPLLSRIEARSVKIFLEYMAKFNQEAQLELLLALTKRVHEFLIKRNDDALTNAEVQLVEAYRRFQFDYSDLDTDAASIR